MCRNWRWYGLYGRDNPFFPPHATRPFTALARRRTPASVFRKPVNVILLPGPCSDLNVSCTSASVRQSAATMLHSFANVVYCFTFERVGSVTARGTTSATARGGRCTTVRERVRARVCECLRRPSVCQRSVHTVEGHFANTVRTHRHEVGLERVATKSVVDEDVPDVIFDRHRVGR